MIRKNIRAMKNFHKLSTTSLKTFCEMGRRSLLQQASCRMEGVGGSTNDPSQDVSDSEAQRRAERVSVTAAGTRGNRQ